MGKTDDYVARASRLGQPALALTDHGTLSGLPEFYASAIKAGVEPVLGAEMYVVEDHNWRAGKGEKQPERSHLTVLARGADGYRVLTELSTLSHHQFYHKPVLDRANLESLGDAAEHLTVLSGCVGSMLSQAVLSGDREHAARELMWWREVFPHFYVELMHHDTEFDRKLNRGLIRLATKYDVPWVVTNDPHFVNRDEHDVHDALLAIQVAKPIDDPDRFRFSGHGYHLRSRKEMRTVIEGNYGSEVWAPGVANTLRIAEDCYTRIPTWDKRTWQVPRFPDAEDSFEMLKNLSYQSLRRIGKRHDEVYLKQLRHELKVMKGADVADFLLITRETIEWARSVGIPVGRGRGSVAGTLVGYLVGLHSVDPIKYKLLFERFLNPARPRMPDIDTDFSQLRRGEVFEHVVEKYGQENVIGVAAFQRMKAKKAFGGLAKAFGYTFQERMRLSKEIVSDDAADTTDITYILPDEVLRRTPELEPIMEKLVGLKTGVSKHPAGVIIADPAQKIREQVPELWIASSKTFSGQYDLDQVEHLGLMKQDFLGLRTLDTIDLCVRWVEQRHGVRLDTDSWSPDDEDQDDKIYAMLAAGSTAGVFQLSGPVCTRGCKDVKPNCFEDLVSITALYRTGPIRAGFPKAFNANRDRGSLSKVPYLHPILRPLLEETWGVVIYQEQVMEIGHVVAGFDMVQVDDIKEAVKHKKSALMLSMRPLFIDGALKTNGIEAELAGKIYDMIEGSSGYLYNRSHSVAYTLTTYATARLKYLYPTEFVAALIATVDPSSPDAKEQRSLYLREAVTLGIKVLPPCVNRSSSHAAPDGMADGVRFGLADLGGIGDTTADKIVAGRPKGGYKAIHQVRRAVLNERSMAALEQGSAMECIGIPGDMEKTEKLLNWQFTDRMESLRRRYRNWVITPDKVDDGEPCQFVGEVVKVTMGKSKATLDKNGDVKYASKPYATWTIRYSPTEQWDLRMWSTCHEHFSAGVGSIVKIRGKWDERWLNISTGDPDDIEFIDKVVASDD